MVRVSGGCSDVNGFINGAVMVHTCMCVYVCLISQSLLVLTLFLTLHSLIRGAYSQNTNAVVRVRFQSLNVEGGCSHCSAHLRVVTEFLPGDNELAILKTRVVLFPGYTDAINTRSEPYIVGFTRGVCIERQEIRD